MRTRRTLVAAFASLLGTAAPAWGQTSPALRRIGILAGRARAVPFESDPISQLPLRLRELGYVEGQDLLIEWRFADGDYARLPGLAAELARLPADVIVAADGTAAALAAKRAAPRIPVVFINVADPVSVGLVESLARPGSNATGVALVGSDYAAKQMEMLASVSPGLTRVAVLLNPANAASMIVLDSLRAAAQRKGIVVRPVEAATTEGISSAFTILGREKTRAVIVAWDSLFFQQRVQVAKLSARFRIASIGGAREYAEAGGLISYGQDRKTTSRRGADFVDKILRGANPGNLPVEMPAKQELVVNRKTAKALGLEIPPELLVLADKVIE